MSGILTLYGEPRSGTTILIKILGQLSKVRNVGEVFKDGENFAENVWKSNFWQTHNAEEKKLEGIKRCFQGPEDITSSIKKSPAEYLKTIKSCAKDKIYIVGKLFPNQCDHYEIDYANEDKKWKDLDLVTEVAVTIRRCPVDAYISWKKAELRNLWFNSDSSNTSIRFDESEYKAWESRHYNWCDAVEKLNSPKVNFIYEQENWEDPKGIAKKFTDSADGSYGEYLPGKLLKKQDLSNSYKRKIINYEQSIDLINEGIEKYNDTLART
jgi:hypothetical protein